MKKILVLLIILMIGLDSCTRKIDTNIKESFDESQGVITTLPSKQKLSYYMINMTQDVDVPIVIFDNISCFDDLKYFLDLNKMVKDMKYIGDMINKYLDSNKQAGVIYIQFVGPYYTHFVMNYTEKKFYIPMYYDELEYLVQKYKTSELKDVEKNSEGLEYLIQNDFITQKSDGYSTNLFKDIQKSYWVYIQDNKFGSFYESDVPKYSFDASGKVLKTE
jgi:hypothetical protein